MKLILKSPQQRQQVLHHGQLRQEGHWPQTQSGNGDLAVGRLQSLEMIKGRLDFVYIFIQMSSIYGQRNIWKVRREMKTALRWWTIEPNLTLVKRPSQANLIRARRFSAWSLMPTTFLAMSLVYFELPSRNRFSSSTAQDDSISCQPRHARLLPLLNPQSTS